MPQKLIVRVMMALKAGADTSNEIAEMLRHPLSSVSATLSEMEDSGLVRKTGRWKFFNGRKTKVFCRELIETK